MLTHLISQQSHDVIVRLSFTVLCSLECCVRCLPVSRCDFNSSKELFITLEVLNKWSMNSINAPLLNYLLHGVNTIADMLGKNHTQPAIV